MVIVYIVSIIAEEGGFTCRGDSCLSTAAGIPVIRFIHDSFDQRNFHKGDRKR